MDGNSSIDFYRLGEATVVLLPEDLFQFLVVTDTKDVMREYIDFHRPSRLVISFERVAVFGSRAIGELLSLTTHVRNLGGEIRLCSMSHAIREIFVTSQLVGTVFEIDESVADATQRFEPDT